MRKQTKLVAVMSAAALLAIGASMTSFAATRGWAQEGEDWVYLNSDGERETSVWRRSGDNYYYLDEDGIMARDQLIDDGTAEAIYYVDENGVRITNAWKSLPNDEGAQVGSQDTEDTPEILWYYFGSAGKAYTSSVTDRKVREINGKYYMFDEDGHMLSGWQTGTNSEDIYYFGTENEGWAYTDWQKLEPREDLDSSDYDDLKWFYFKSNGKAARDESRNISGRYYHFDENGVMDDDWYQAATSPTAASGAQAFAALNGTLSNGWVYTGDADLDADERYDNDDLYWYYLVTVREGGKVARSIPYNYQADDGGNAKSGLRDTTLTPGAVRAKVIKNKTYIFDADGKMLKGFVVISDRADGAATTVKNAAGDKIVTYNNINNTVDGSFDYGDIENAYDAKIVDHFRGKDHPYTGSTGGGSSIEGRSLVQGLYYFNEADGSVQGQMMTGRTAITKDGETFYYYFSKDSSYPGYAYVNAIQDGYLYGSDGKCVTADDGNNYAVYTAENDIRIMNKANTDGTRVVISAGDRVIVSRTGKVRTSGTVTIDGVKYTVTGSIITDEKAVD